jgi:O-antigen ligase
MRVIEACFAATVVAMFSNALVGPLFDPTQLGGDTIGWLRLVWLPVYAIVTILACLRLPELIRFWRPAGLVLVLVALAAISILWSSDPQTTGRRVLALAFTTLFGLYLPASFGGRDCSRLLAATFLVMAVGALAACLGNPAFGIDHDANPGAWKGLWYEKNQMGDVMAYGAMASAAAALTDPKWRRWWLLGALFCAGLVVMSRSLTFLVVLLGALGCMGLFYWARRGPIAGLISSWVCVTVLSVVALFASVSSDAFYNLLGKDPTISGRTDIWRAARHWADQAPWLGYGYEGFWTDASTPAKYIRGELGWPVPNAHNGWLDVRLELGWVGFALVAVVFAAASVAVLVRGWKVKDGGWSAAFFISFLVATLSESLILEQNDLSWVLCVAAMTRLLGPQPREEAATAALPFGSVRANEPLAIGARGGAIAGG